MLWIEIRRNFENVENFFFIFSRSVQKIFRKFVRFWRGTCQVFPLCFLYQLSVYLLKSFYFIFALMESFQYTFQIPFLFLRLGFRRAAHLLLLPYTFDAPLPLDDSRAVATATLLIIWTEIIKMNDMKCKFCALMQILCASTKEEYDD